MDNIIIILLSLIQQAAQKFSMAVHMDQGKDQYWLHVHLIPTVSIFQNLSLLVVVRPIQHPI